MESFKINEDLSKIDTTDLLKRLESFDEKFGGIASYLKHLSEQEGETGRDLSDDTYEQNLLKKDIFSDIEPILESTGLDVVIEKSHSRELGSVNEDTDIEHVELVKILKSGKQFVTYLKSLNPEVITESQKKSLEEILYDLTNAINYRYDLDNPKDDFFELIGNATEIVSECKRIGIKEVHNRDVVSLLEETIRCAREKCLKEFILAKDFREFSFELYAHEYFPPKNFKENWDNLINILLKISENPNATRVYQNAVVNAKKAIDEAIVFFSTTLRSGDDVKKEYWIDEKIQKQMIAIAQSIKLRLSEL